MFDANKIGLAIGIVMCLIALSIVVIKSGVLDKLTRSSGSQVCL